MNFSDSEGQKTVHEHSIEMVWYMSIGTLSFWHFITEAKENFKAVFKITKT